MTCFKITTAHNPKINQRITISYPDDCQKSDSLKCLRGGNNVHEYFWVFTVFCFVLAILFVSISMFNVYKTVQNIEEQSFQYSFARYRNQSNYYKRSQRIKIQGMLYGLALVLTYNFPILFYFIWLVSGDVYAIIDVLISVFFPLQGFFNALIYSIPVYMKIYKKYKEKKKAAAEAKEEHEVEVRIFEKKEHEETKEEIRPLSSKSQERKIARMESSDADINSSINILSFNTALDGSQVDDEHNIYKGRSNNDSNIATGDEFKQEIFDEPIKNDESDINFFSAFDDDSDECYW